LAKTADRSVLGCMNDMAFVCAVAIGDAGGLAHVDLGELNQALHRNINSSRGCRPPVELAAQQFERGAIKRTRNRQGAGAIQLAPRRSRAPAGSVSRSVAQHHPPGQSVTADMYAGAIV